jgi:hypothetical protein
MRRRNPLGHLLAAIAQGGFYAPQRKLPASPPGRQPLTGGAGGTLAPDPSTAFGQVQMHEANGGTGGMLAPDEAPDAGGSQAGDPLANLINGFQKWSQQHGGHTDPLAQLAQGHRTAGGMLEGFGGRGVRQVTDPSQQGLAQVARVNQSGNARNGLAFQTYDLGHGRFVHVYFDPKTGKRTPIYFNKS